LPQKAFPGLRVVAGQGKHPAHQPRHHVGAERQAGRSLPLLLSLAPRALQEGRVGKDIRRRP